MFDGRWNRRLGWAMLVVGFAGAVGLDPWSLSERDPALLVGSSRMAIRQTQAVVIGMAFLQLTIAQILSVTTVLGRVQAVATFLSSLGALVYIAGYFLHVGWTESPWLMVTGALLNFVALAVLAAGTGVRHGRRDVQVVLMMFCFGMLIDALMGLFAAHPLLFLPDYIGREDEVRPRMLRLARAAAIALPMLTFLYHGLAARQRPAVGVVRWGGIAMMFGAIGMPLILTAAALTFVQLKLLLGLPAHATLLGTLAGVWLAHRAARPLERWGWLIIALSMAIGLLMGLYAFDGPLPSPEFMGEYNNHPRRLWRLAHAYCIVLGLLSIFLARELDRARPIALFTRVGTAMFVGGSVCTVLVLVLAATVELPAPILGIGPAAVALGLVVCLAACGGSIPRDRELLP